MGWTCAISHSAANWPRGTSEPIPSTPGPSTGPAPQMWQQLSVCKWVELACVFLLGTPPKWVGVPGGVPSILQAKAIPKQYIVHIHHSAFEVFQQELGVSGLPPGRQGSNRCFPVIWDPWPVLLVGSRCQFGSLCSGYGIFNMLGVPMSSLSNPSKGPFSRSKSFPRREKP